MSSIVSADALRVISEVVDNPASAPVERVARPFWQTTPCPAWCAEVHTDAAFFEDRQHQAAPGYPMNLSLYRAAAGDGTTGPATIDASIRQHYRETEPIISLTVPKHGEEPYEADGETDVELTPAETRSLRDRLTLILDMLDGEPLDTELGECTDGATRRSVEHATRLGQPLRSDVTITSNLIQWVEPASGPELEVEVDIASNPDTYTPAQAHEFAARMREAAARIDRLAEAAEKANVAIGGAK